MPYIDASDFVEGLRDKEFESNTKAEERTDGFYVKRLGSLNLEEREKHKQLACRRAGCDNTFPVSEAIRNGKKYCCKLCRDIANDRIKE